MKILKITGIVVLVIILLMIILPLLFKDQIVEIVKKEANKNLNATLNFTDAGLNLFSSFPNISLSLDQLSIVNKAPFEGDTLLYMKEFKASVDLWSVIAGDQIKIKGIKLVEPDIFVYVLKDSTANYNITKPDTAAKTDTGKTNLSIAIKEYSIEKGNIAYIDQTSDMALIIKDLDHTGKGDFSQANFLLETETNIGSLTLEKNGTKFLNGVTANAVMNIDANMPSKKFTFRDNKFSINNLALNFAGYVQKAENSILMDVTFASVNNSFKDIISLIPVVYKQNFSDLTASGTMSLKGKVSGEYKDEQLPKINIDLTVNKGNFKYPKLPTPVNNVNMNLNVSNPGGTADQTVINMSSLHFEIAKDPFDAKLLVKNPTAKPYIDAGMKGRIDLGKLKTAVYIEGINNLSGIINADFQAKGTIAGKDPKSIENLTASGNISVNNIVYGSETFPDEINVATGNLVLTPKKFSLNNLAVRIGKSDLRAEGQLENMISYVLSNGTLKGSLSLSSNYFDLNPFMQENKTEKTSAKDTIKLEAVSVPDKINFTMNSNFNKIIFDNLTLENVKGTIIIANERVSLKNMSMNTLGGSMVADGFYYGPEGGNPDISFNLNIGNLGFKEAYQYFVTVQRFAPMAKYIDGKFSSKLSMTSSLDQNMKPVWNSFNSKGSFSIQNAAINGFKPLQVVGDKLNLNALKNPSLNNVATTFNITNGRLYISPFDFKVAGYNVNVAGSNGIDQTIDYTMGVDIPVSNLKQQGNSAISKLVGKDLQLLTANSVNVKANIRGTIDNPAVSTSAGKIAEETTKQVTEQVKQEVNKQIEQKKEEVKKEVQKQVDTVTNKLKQEAEKKLRSLFRKK